MKTLYTMLTVVLFCQPSLAQLQPGTAPFIQAEIRATPALVNRARHIGAVFSKALIGPPSSIRPTHDNIGSPALELVWEFGPQTEYTSHLPCVRITLDGAGRIYQYADWDGTQKAEERFKTDKNASITPSQASLVLREHMRAVGIPPGDWRELPVTNAWEPEPEPFIRVYMYRFVNGIRCTEDRIWGQIEIYTGKVVSMFVNDKAIRLPVTNDIVSGEQAREIAVSTYLNAGGDPANVPRSDSPPVPIYLPLNFKTLYCRLAYRFGFEEPSDDPNRKSGLAAVIETVVDAQTGEIWYMRNILGGGGKIKGKVANLDAVKTSRRIALAAALLPLTTSPAYHNLGKALAAGKPGKSRYKKPEGAAIEVPLGEEVITLIVAKNKKTLYWQEGREWRGVPLDPKDGEQAVKVTTPASAP